MKKPILFIISYFLFWLVFFEVGRFLFLILNTNKIVNVDSSELSLAFIHGVPLDMSIAGYISVLVVLLIVCFWNTVFERFLIAFLKGYTIIMLIVTSFLILLDAKLYQFWDAKLSVEVLKYVDNIGDVINTFRFLDVLFPLFFAFGLGVGSYFLFKKFVLCQIKDVPKFSFLTSLITLLIGGNLFFAIRGGIDIYPEVRLGNPISSSIAYYSHNSFCNHVSLNPVWYGLYSISIVNYEDKLKKYYGDDKQLIDWLSEIRNIETETNHILKAARPDVVLIIVESLSAHIFAPLGGHSEGTPRLNKWMDKSILFENFYASGARSDKGVSTLITGVPNTPNVSVMQYPNMFDQVPSLYKDLKNNGYETSFYYGGDMGFVNFQSFFLETGVEKIVSRIDYPKSEWKSKWGVPDGKMLTDFLTQIDQSTSPSFNSIFTLSSHHPFDIPTPYHFEGDDDDSKFLSSVYYTDSCLGDFLEKAEKKEWWDNTLVLIVADHSVNNFGKVEWNMPERFRIPMIWTGGVLLDSLKGTRVSTYGGQADVAITLLSQLKIPKEHYKWGKNLLAKDPASYAFYGNGDIAGFVADSTRCVFNFESNLMKDTTGIENYPVNPVKGYLQLITESYLTKK